MIKDRGNIKWSSMMLPEHKKLLNELYKEQDFIKKPELTQDKYEEINNILVTAINKNKPIKIKVYEKNFLKIVEGMIKKYEPWSKQLKIAEFSGKVINIAINSIVDAELFT